MIEKQCQFSGRDEAGLYFHLLHPGYDDSIELVKHAAASAPMLEEVKAFLKQMARPTGKQHILLSALGAGEFWGANTNGDFFPENSLIHTPQNWAGLSNKMQQMVGTKWEWGYPTFYNAHAFQHHVNKDPNRAFGDVEYACWDPEMKRVLLVVGIDRARAKSMGAIGIVDKIDNGEFPDVSMGCRVPFDLCVPAGTLLSANSLKPIEDVEVGEAIRSHTGALLTVKETFRRTANELVSIQPVGTPDPLRCTPNHPVLIIRRDTLRSCSGSANGNRRRHTVDTDGYCSFCDRDIDIVPEWIEAWDVQIGDYVLTPTGRGTLIPTRGLEDAPLARVFGYYIGDGSPIRQRRGRKRDGEYYLQGLQFSVGHHEPDHAERLFNTLLELRGRNEPKVYAEGQGRRADSVRLYDQDIAAEVVSACGEKSRGKVIPEECFHWVPELRWHLLGALIDTDGSQDHNTQKGSVRYTTVNRGLAYGVRDLCLSLGIAASANKQWANDFDGSKIECYHVLIPASYSEMLAPYSEKVRPYDRRCGTKGFFWGGYYCSPIRSVVWEEYDEPVPVFNVAVEEDESYVANGIAVHNCSICTDWTRITGNPRKDLAEHRRSAIRGISVTTKDYCQHLKFEVGRVHPDGKKVWMWNLHPRFFDISFVFIGADKSSKVMAKLAGACPLSHDKKKCASCVADHCDIPSGHVHDVWSREKTAKSYAGPNRIEAMKKNRLRLKQDKDFSMDDYIRLDQEAIRKDQAAGRVPDFNKKASYQAFPEFEDPKDAARINRIITAQRKRLSRFKQAKTATFRTPEERSAALRQEVQERQTGVDNDPDSIMGKIKDAFAEACQKEGEHGEFPKMGSDLTKLANLDLQKRAEIIKRIQSHFNRTMPSVGEDEPDIPKETLDEMSKCPADALGTAGGMGIILKPSEFQRVFMGSIGKPELADALEEKGITFSPGAEPDPHFSIAHRIVPRILEALRPLMGERSALGPPLHRRRFRVTIIAAKPSNCVDHPMLDKVASAYEAYRRSVVYGITDLVPRMIHEHPAILDDIVEVDLFNNEGVGLVKAGSDVVQSLLGMFPATYINRAYMPGPVSRYVEDHANFAGLRAAGALAASGGVA